MFTKKIIDLREKHVHVLYIKGFKYIEDFILLTNVNRLKPRYSKSFYRIPKIK